LPRKRTTHPIPDKAVVAVDFPDKVYMGSFSRGSKFEARAENDGLFIKLLRDGKSSRVVEVHLHHYLLADILSDWAISLESDPITSEDHRENLLEALKKVEKAVRRKRGKTT
jgi:hypothetical protein